MYENIIFCFTCLYPNNHVFIIKNNDINVIQANTLYIDGDITKFVIHIKKIYDSMHYSQDNITFVDYSTNIPFKDKLYYLSKIFKQKNIYLYSTNLTPSLNNSI